MKKKYYSLGFMSGTSMDGVDASIIQSDGKTKYKVILDKYFKYSKEIYQKLINLRNKIKSSIDLKRYKNQINLLEKEITLFHAEATKKILKKKQTNIDFIGFHGQTIFHDSKQKISKQLGDGKLLSKLTKKKVIYNFRQNDINNGGQGAPLTPIFHQLILDQYKIKLPALIVNIGGIINVSWKKPTGKITSSDTGPGNCMIDQWMRIKSNKKYDKNGIISKKGNIDEGRLQYLYNSYIKMGLNRYSSYDIHDFNSQIQYIKDLSLKDGAATLNEYTAELLSRKIFGEKKLFFANIILSGGGRKNKFLVQTIKKKIKYPLKSIDEFGIDGDFVESQAFAYLAIRSFLKLPISFPETTGVVKPISGGILAK